MRVVLEVSAEVDPRSFDLSANEQAGDRLVLDLYDKQAQHRRPSRKSVKASGKRDIIIAIDAGHGGEDPGAIGPTGLREKDVVLAIAKELNRPARRRTRAFSPPDSQRRLLRQPQGAPRAGAQAPGRPVRFHPC